MGIQGTIKTMPLPDVLQWLSNAKGTGILHVRSPKGVKKRIFFRGGVILSTASSDPREYLGQFLLSQGLLNEEQLNMAMETQAQTNLKLGRIMLTVGMLEEKQLTEMLVLKAKEILYDLFLWEEGEFHFEDLNDIEDDLVPISLDVVSIVMEGMRRKDEWARVQADIPTSRAVLMRTDLKLKREALNPKSLLLRVYDGLDGQKSIAEMSLHLHATEFDVTLTLHKLLSKDLVKLAGEKAHKDDIDLGVFTEKLMGEAEKALVEGRFSEAMNLFRYALKARPDDPKAQDGLAKAEEGHFGKYFTEVAPLNSKLELAVPLANLAKADLTPQEGYIASRIDGTWDIESIVKVSPLPKNEALRAIRKLLERGLVRLKQGR